MAVRRFRDDDRNYLAWRSEHLDDGLIANIADSNPLESRIHRASCVTLRIPVEKGQNLTGPYWKACSTDLAELRQIVGDIQTCAVCH